MKKLSRKILITILLSNIFILDVTIIHSSTEQRNYLNFLSIGLDTRSLGMAGATTGLRCSALSVNWNPAIIQTFENTEIALMHNQYIKNIFYDICTITTQFNSRCSFAFSGLYNNSGKWVESLNDSIKTDSQTPDTTKTKNFTQTISLAFQLRKDLIMGINLKPVFKSVNNVFGQTISTDLGLLYFYRNLSIGFSTRNLGPPMILLDEKYFLPTTLSYGISYQFPAKSIIAFELEQPIGQDFITKTGFEYDLFNFLKIRSGYILSSLKKKIWGSPGIALGLGINKKNFKFDYAANFIGSSGISQSISLAYSFRQPLQSSPEIKTKIPTKNNSNENSKYYDLVNLYKKRPKTAGKYFNSPINVQKQLFTISDLIFKNQRPNLNKKYEYLLQKILNFFNQYDDSYIIIEVHTDNQTTSDHSMQLSMARAKNLMDYFVQHTNINPKNIEIYGYGDIRPIVPNNTPKNREKNRRVEITIFYSENEQELKVQYENIAVNDKQRTELIVLDELIELVQYAALKYDMYYRIKGKQLKSFAKLEVDEAEYIARLRAKKWGYKLVKRVVKNETFLYELLSPVKDLNYNNVWKRIYTAWNGKLTEPAKLYRGQAVFVLYK